jgi:hypothetical protein
MTNINSFDRTGEFKAKKVFKLTYFFDLEGFMENYFEGAKFRK